MNDKVEAFVLSQSDYKDNDLLLQVISKEYGHLSLVGKSAKKISSKNHFLVMCIYEFIIDYKFGKTIYSIHGSRLLNNYFEDNDIELITIKNIICELTLKNKEIDLYDALVFVFDHFNKDNAYLLLCMFLSYLIKRFGITPVVDACAICGKKEVISFSNNAGGFLCKDHINGQEIMSIDTLKKIRLIIKGELKDFEILKQFDYSYNDFVILMEFFIHNSDIRINSYDLLKQIH